MGVLQFVPRLLRAENRLASMTITRMYDTEKKIALRRRRLKMPRPTSVPCYMALRRSENRCNQPRLKPLIDECLIDPCGAADLPLDLDNYTPSDKRKRKYQRTWCECYLLPKKHAKTEKCYPERPRRKLAKLRSKAVKCRDEDINPPDAGRLKPEKLIEVTRIGPWPCCKIVAPGCEAGRRPPSCDAGRMVSCCKKRRTQYPSFSECIPIGLLDPIPPCECEKRVNLCDVWAYWRRMHK